MTDLFVKLDKGKRLPNFAHGDSRLNSDVESLVDRAITGDAEAFGRLYDLYADRIYRHIYYRTSSLEDAKDLTQEVFVKAWQVLSRYKRTNAPFLAWLFTISHNRVIDYYRTRKDHAYLNTEITMDSEKNSPDKLLEAEYTQQEVRKAILRLPGEQQQVIMMSFVEGFEYSEIARALNKTEGNIRVMLHRGLKKLREMMVRNENRVG
jgi:RNA polymerase sigma-70 factor, ECF subfamily